MGPQNPLGLVLWEAAMEITAAVDTLEIQGPNLEHVRIVKADAVDVLGGLEERRQQADGIQDLQGARLYRGGPSLVVRPHLPFHEPRIHAVAHELGGGEKPRGAGADDQNVLSHQYHSRKPAAWHGSLANHQSDRRGALRPACPFWPKGSAYTAAYSISYARLKTILLTRSSTRGAAGWLCLRCSRATSTSLSSPSALRVWRQLHREPHNTARIVAPPFCTACMIIASSIRAGIPLLVTLTSSLAPRKTQRITQMSDIWDIIDVAGAKPWLVSGLVQLVQGRAEESEQPDSQVAGGDAHEGRAQAEDLQGVPAQHHPRWCAEHRERDACAKHPAKHPRRGTLLQHAVGQRVGRAEREPRHEECPDSDPELGRRDQDPERHAQQRDRRHERRPARQPIAQDPVEHSSGQRPAAEPPEHQPEVQGTTVGLSGEEGQDHRKEGYRERVGDHADAEHPDHEPVTADKRQAFRKLG